MSLNKYQMFQISCQKDTPQTKFDLQLKTNKFNEYDINLKMNLSKEIHITEYNQNIIINNRIFIAIIANRNPVTKP